jgi:hypothetical protein
MGSGAVPFLMGSKRAKGRDPSGRFQKGHEVKSPGNPRLKHLAALQEAVREAITPEALQSVLGKLRDLALDDGDVAAARVLLDRVLGRPRVEENAGASIELPSVETAAGCSQALSEILKAVSGGEIDPSTAAQLAGLVEAARKGIELVILEERISALEGRL